MRRHSFGTGEDLYYHQNVLLSFFFFKSAVLNALSCSSSYLCTCPRAEGLGSGPPGGRIFFSSPFQMGFELFKSWRRELPGQSFAQRSVRLVFLHFQTKCLAFFFFFPSRSLIRSLGNFDEVLSWHKATFGRLFEDSVQKVREHHWSWHPRQSSSGSVLSEE